MFFYSSRRRHTIFDCDWSSDVCSSDLGTTQGVADAALEGVGRALDQEVGRRRCQDVLAVQRQPTLLDVHPAHPPEKGLGRRPVGLVLELDRKSTRLNSSHSQISYAVFCLKKKTRHCASSSSRDAPGSGSSRLRFLASSAVRCLSALTISRRIQQGAKVLNWKPRPASNRSS